MALLAAILLASVAVPSSAECWADSTRYIGSAAAVVVASVTHSESGRFDALVQHVWLGSKVPKTLSFSYKDGRGEDDDHFAAGTRWLLIIQGVAPDGTASLFQYRCLASAVPADDEALMEKAGRAAARTVSDRFLKERDLKWGAPLETLRTGSRWFRVEYAKAPNGAERVVLVEPQSFEPSFPLRR